MASLTNDPQTGKDLNPAGGDTNTRPAGGGTIDPSPPDEYEEALRKFCDPQSRGKPPVEICTILAQNHMDTIDKAAKEGVRTIRFAPWGDRLIICNNPLTCSADTTYLQKTVGIWQITVAFDRD